MVAREALVMEKPDAVATPTPVPSPKDGGFVVVHENYDVHELAGAKEGIRRHAFDDLRGFAAWLRREATPDKADVLVDRSSVVCVLDPKREEAERVSCALALDPCFAALCSLIGKPLSQNTLVQFARTWRSRIADSDVLLGALRTLQVVKGGDFKSEIDEVGATRFIGASDKRDVAVRIPPEISLTTPVFRGVMRNDGDQEARYDIEVLVTVDLTEGVLFALAFPAYDDVYTRARLDAADYLQALLSAEFLVALGKAETATRKKTDRE
jgi:hypothetical protein